MDTELTAKQVKALGYRIISSKYRMAARVDREDWREFCEKNGHPVDADWYRRCLSKDKITLSAIIAKQLPNSGHDTTGYVQPKTQENKID